MLSYSRRTRNELDPMHWICSSQSRSCTSFNPFLSELFSISAHLNTGDFQCFRMHDADKALPSLSSDILQQIASSLQSSGLQCKEDLKDILPVIQIRKLLQMFKSETEMVTLNLQVLPAPSASSSTSPSTCISLRDFQAKPDLYTNGQHFQDVG
ncbi:hypothetical protein G5714_022097 [Onychostoma macrolepis]|uniref:Uncharacterized protein n=1 Tax=Onychostoma macrolepis TaxID=369639 RepID=A0A7J6BSW9_9TELE|nr:hypothetical protein G5714_022097 [Onychostoma macrolepis]